MACTLCLQVYSLNQGKRDVETVLTMGIMEDVSIFPQPAGGTISCTTFFLQLT